MAVTMEKHKNRADAFRSNRSQVLDTSKSSKFSAKVTPVHSGKSTASEAASIQRSLARTQTLLQQELQRVSYVSHAIEQDGKLLSETMENQQTMNVGKAKKALTALDRAQQRERHMLLLSITFFWAVVAYILWGRVISRLPFYDRIQPIVLTLSQSAAVKVLHSAQIAFVEATRPLGGVSDEVFQAISIIARDVFQKALIVAGDVFEKSMVQGKDLYETYYPVALEFLEKLKGFLNL